MRIHRVVAIRDFSSKFQRVHSPIQLHMPHWPGHAQDIYASQSLTFYRVDNSLSLMPPYPPHEVHDSVRLHLNG